CEITFRRGVPPLMNDDRMLDATIGAVKAQFGDVISEQIIGFGGEDFSYVSERVPASHLRVGSGRVGHKDTLHNSSYTPDERCIGTGVAALSRAAVEMLA